MIHQNQRNLNPGEGRGGSRLRRAYLKGYRLELNVKRALDKVGLHVFRCAGSKPVDLVVVNNYATKNDVVLVECKAERDADPARLAVEVYENYRIPSVAVVKRDSSVWEWALCYGSQKLEVGTLLLLKNALGNICSVMEIGPDGVLRRVSSPFETARPASQSSA
jgi:hypothetical protein